LAAGVSFDIWNTLLNLQSFYRAIADALAKITHRDSDKLYRSILDVYRDALRLRLEGEFKRIILDSAEFFASRLGVSAEELFRAVVEAADSVDASSLIYGDVVDALKKIRTMGIKMAVIGNVMFWPGMITRLLLKRGGILEYFDATVFSDEVGYSKPSREIFEYTAKKLGITVHELVHVGDSVENDLAGAIFAGAVAVLINRNSTIDILQIGRRAYLINDLRRIVDILKQGLDRALS